MTGRGWLAWNQGETTKFAVLGLCGKTRVFGRAEVSRAPPVPLCFHVQTRILVTRNQPTLSILKLHGSGSDRTTKCFNGKVNVEGACAHT